MTTTIDAPVDLLSDFGLTTETAEITARLGTVEKLLTTEDYRRAHQVKFQGASRAFSTWHTGVTKFDGNREQVVRAYQQQKNVARTIKQILAAIKEIERQIRNAKSKQTGQESFEEANIKLTVVIRGLGTLIPLSQDQKDRVQATANRAINQDQRQDAWRNHPPIGRTDSAPPNPDKAAETPASPTPLQPTSSSRIVKYGSFKFSDQSSGILGNTYTYTGGSSSSQPLSPIYLNENIEYGDVEAAGTAHVQAGEKYHFGA